MNTAKPSRPRAAQLGAAAGQAAFDHANAGLEALAVKGKGYDRLIDALNRLPRPAMMLLTVALFAYATLDPAGFAARMQVLDQVPDPLWWLQGAVVTYFFGAREAHYLRLRKAAGTGQAPASAG